MADEKNEATATEVVDDPSSQGNVAPTVDDVRKLQKALDSERALRRTAQSKVDEYERTRAADEKRRADEHKDADAKAKERDDARFRHLSEQGEAEKRKWDEERKVLEGRLDKYVVRAEINSGMAKHGLKSELLGLHLQQVVRTVKGDGEDVSVRVFGKDGVELYSRQPGKQHEFMGVDEYLGTVAREAYPECYPGTGSTGSGASGQMRPQGGARTVSIHDQSALSASLEDIASGKVRVVR